MKKRTLALGALMAGVALTSYSVSGTYAKYTSEIGTVSDTVKVAKWFKTIEEPESLKLNLLDTAKFVDTKSLKSDDLVAPGTYGVVKLDVANDMLSTITGKFGTPEVAYTVVPAITVTDGTSGKIHFWIDDSDAATDVEGTVYYQGEGAENDIEDLEAAISKDITTEVNADGTFKSQPVKYLHWVWVYEDKVPGNVAEQDKTDTGLGTSAANAEPDSEPKVELKLDLTATQVKPTASE